MPKNSWNDYSTTAASNTDVHSVSIAEGMAPSDVNNALREIMTDTANFDQGNVTLTSALAVASGGTGAATHTANNVLVGAGTSAVTSVAPSTSGNVLTSNGTVWQSSAAAGASGANLLINGAFTVAQRGTSFDIDPNASGTDETYTLDRWHLYAYLVDSDYTVTQETLTPGTDEPYDHGFRYSIKVNCDVASASPGATDTLALAQKLEGQDVQSLAYGDAQAKASTVSFWHKHTKTGTHCVTILRSGGHGWASKQYTQTTTNTWEYATVTIPANTSDIPANSAAAALDIQFGISVGSTYTSGAEAAWGSVNGNYFPGQVNNMDDVANNFEVAGIKWELGSDDTTYIHEHYGDTLARCQRYYQHIGVGMVGLGAATAKWTAGTVYPVTMRAAPTASVTDSVIHVTDGIAGLGSASAAIDWSQISKTGGQFRFTGWSGGNALTQYRPYIAYNYDIEFLALTAEL